MLTRDLTPCFVQDFGLGSRTGYEKALLVELFDRTFTCLDHRISASDEDAGPTRRPVAVVMRRDGRLQEVDPWSCVSADVTADAYIEDIKYCPFCGEEL